MSASGFVGCRSCLRGFFIDRSGGVGCLKIVDYYRCLVELKILGLLPSCTGPEQL